MVSAKVGTMAEYVNVRFRFGTPESTFSFLFFFLFEFAAFLVFVLFWQSADRWPADFARPKATEAANRSAKSKLPFQRKKKTVQVMVVNWYLRMR